MASEEKFHIEEIKDHVAYSSHESKININGIY